MKGFAWLLPVLVALQVGVQPALAWTWPVDGPVLRPFVLGDDPYSGGQHRGVDIGAPAGAPVRAPAAGSVSFVGTVPTGGKTITIRTADGYAVTLQHLGSYAVSRDAEVAEGDPIAALGEEADAFVHLGVRHADDENGYVDPLGLLPPPVQAPSPPDPPPAHPEPVLAPSHGGGAATHHHAVHSPPVVVQEPSSKAARELPNRPRTHRVHATPRVHAALREAVPLRGRLAPEVRPAPERPAAVPPAQTRGGDHTLSAAVSAAARKRTPWPIPAGAALLALGLLGAAGLARRRGELGDAGAAHRAPAMLLQRASPATEDAHGLRLRQEDDVVLDGDLERILLAQREALADLDRNHDPAEVVDVADDPRSRCSPHRARPNGALRGSVRPQFLVAFRSRRISGNSSPGFAISNHQSPLQVRVGSFV